MKYLLLLWKFSRPHTIIGSIISITTLYAMACNGTEIDHLGLLILAILIGISCNIYIVGINQIEDIEIDKINKPYLPLASGELSMNQAKWIIRFSAVFCLIASMSLNKYLVLIMALSMGIGWAYSKPPFYLRKHHLPAAISISTVRGILINFGGFSVFNKLINGSYQLNNNILILCFFIVLFSIVIAWFKDLPDMSGDAQFKIKTMAILYSPRYTLIIGNVLVIIAYLSAISYYALSNVNGSGNTVLILKYGHLILLALFIIHALTIKKLDKQNLKLYYKRFWWFFFLEYLLYLFTAF